MFEKTRRKAFLVKADKMQVLQRLKKSKIEYYIDHNTQGTTVKIETKFFKYLFTDGAINPKELWFLSKVKSEVQKRLNENLFSFTPLSRQPIFFKFNKPQQKFYTDVVELDINAAYWNVLHQTGAITNETYLKGLTVSKMARLAAIGSLGKQTFIKYYDGEKLINLPTKISPLREFWKYVVVSADIIIDDVFCKLQSPFFFWVDAIFLPKSEAPEAIKLFYNLGMKVKAKPIDWLYFNIEEMKYYVLELGEEFPKEFYLPRTQNAFTNNFLKQFQK